MSLRTTLRALAATAAVAGAVALAAPASAATPIVTLSNVGDPNTLPAGQALISDFNDAGNPTGVLGYGFSLVLDNATVGVNEGVDGYSGTLPNDPTHYLTIAKNGSATLFSTLGLQSFSFYMGSPDTYNSIRFIGDGYDETLTGGQISDGYVGQSWGWGTRINFDFGDAKVNQIVISSSDFSYELDNIAGSVPEPATWAMMIVGFGSAGAMLRRRRTQTTLA